MPTYTYQCPVGHVTELVLPMADDKPESVTCQVPMREALTLSYVESCTPAEREELRRAAWAGEPYPEEASAGGLEFACELDAARVFHAPVAVHWSGAGGSYHEDVYRNDSGRYGWKRRPNPGDDLPIPVDAHI